MPPEVTSVLSQLLLSVADALRVGKTSVQLNTEELALNPACACFGVVSTAIPVSVHNPEKLLSFDSAAAKLPENLLKQFRMVNITTPDLKLVVEVLLLGQGMRQVYDVLTQSPREGSR